MTVQIVTGASTTHVNMTSSPGHIPSDGPVNDWLNIPERTCGSEVATCYSSKMHCDISPEKEAQTQSTVSQSWVKHPEM